MLKVLVGRMLSRGWEITPIKIQGPVTSVKLLGGSVVRCCRDQLGSQPKGWMELTDRTKSILFNWTRDHQPQGLRWGPSDRHIFICRWRITSHYNSRKSCLQGHASQSPKVLFFIPGSTQTIPGHSLGEYLKDNQQCMQAAFCSCKGPAFLSPLPSCPVTYSLLARESKSTSKLV